MKTWVCFTLLYRAFEASTATPTALTVPDLYDDCIVLFTDFILIKHFVSYKCQS